MSAHIPLQALDHKITCRCPGLLHHWSCHHL